MDTTVIGEGPLEIQEVARIMRTSASFPLLVENWKQLAYTLEIETFDIVDIERRVNIGTYEPAGIPVEIIKIWRARQGGQATFKAFCDALRNIGHNDIAESLEIKFLIVDLRKSLRSLLDTRTQRQQASDLGSFLHANGGPGEYAYLLNERVFPPDVSKYYISRTISFRTELEKKCFQDPLTSNHIFLFKGIEIVELAEISKYQPIDYSGNQLQRLTVRFMVLELDEDFKRIVAMATDPVHLIEVINKRFYWITSSKCLEVIQKFLTTEESIFTEKDMVNKIATLPSPCTLSLCDSPGIGKTYLLANMANNLQKDYRNAVVLFISLPDFIRHVEQKELTESNAESAICLYSSTSNEARAILQQMMKNDSFSFYLFLDGYDEVVSKKLKKVDEFLIKVKNLNNVKIIAATRQSLKSRLETILNSLSFKMLPFNQSNQLVFLIKYWTRNHDVQECSQLTYFGQKCLRSVQMELSDRDRSITGIPLMCLMLAEVCSENARLSSIARIVPDMPLKFTLLHIFKSFVDLRCREAETLNNISREDIIAAHVYLSYSLLFPNFVHKIELFLSGRRAVDEATIYSIGIIEKGRDQTTPKFVHRTFAEYFLASHLVTNLTKDMTFVRFLCQEILGGNGVCLKESAYEPTVYKLKHSVVAYFVNMCIYDTSRQTKQDIATYTMTYDELDSDHVCKALAATLCHNLEDAFKFMSKLIPSLNKRSRKRLYNKYFNALLHLAAQFSDSVSFIQTVLSFMMDKFGMQIKDLVFNSNAPPNQVVFPWVPNCTPLHVAIHRGAYNIFKYLLGQYKDDFSRLNHPLHVCVYKSAENDVPAIEEKLSIIETLVSLNSDLLYEEFQNCLPILQEGVHLKLIQQLVSLGSNVNAYSEEHGTILHRAACKSTYANLVHWALLKSFKLINHTDMDGRTALMVAITRFSTLEMEMLRLFLEAGADFNAQDQEGNSVLFYAVKSSNNLKFIQNILDFGANPNHTNKNGENVADVIANDPNTDSGKAKLRLLSSMGLSRISGRMSRLLKWAFE